MNKNLYFGFEKINNFFIAKPEKALLDALYLMSLGRYQFDLTALDIKKMDSELLKTNMKLFPQFTQHMIERYGIIQKT